MATTSNASFDSMLNEHLSYEMLTEELFKKDYILSKIEKDNTWKGGRIPVPFRGSMASSVAFGGLTVDADIVQAEYVRGHVDGYKEVWGSLKFNHKDIITHDGKVSEQSFLRILPDAIDDFIDYMKMCVALNMTNGKYFAKVMVNGSAGGVVVVDRIERFQVNQKVGLMGVAAPLVYYYVKSINTDANSLVLSLTLGGAATDVTAYTTADLAKFYFQGSATDGLTSLKPALLSLVNGGDAMIHGVTKTLWPFLQAINIDASTATALNLLTLIFDAFTTIRMKGKGNPSAVVMSYKHLGSIMKILEAGKGAYNLVPGSLKVNVYGYTTIQIFGVKGTLEVVGVYELDNDYMLFLDWKGLKLHSNGFFRKRVSPDGSSFHEVRSASGFYYIVDVLFFGEMIISRPSAQGIMYNIPNY